MDSSSTKPQSPHIDKPPLHKHYLLDLTFRFLTLIPLIIVAVGIVGLLVTGAMGIDDITITPSPSVIPSPSHSPTLPPSNTLNYSNLSAAHNQFGLSILSQLYSVTPNQNIIISPTSLSYAFTMLYNGADGQTKQQLQDILGYSDELAASINTSTLQLSNSLTSDPDVQFSIANSLWIQNDLPIRDEYISTNQKYLGAEVSNIDFTDDASADLVNSWVSEKTNEKIPTIIEPPLSADLVMMLINAIYFNGTWTYEFDPELTQQLAFTLPDESSITTDFMSQSRDDFFYFEDDALQIVQLPYGESKRYAMNIYLPKADLASLMNALNAEQLSSWDSAMTKREGSVHIPKFTLEYEKELKDTLSEMGLSGIFTDSANFDRMSQLVELAVDFVKHKTFIEVDEEGTEAAAVTSIGMMLTSVQDEDDSFSFIANKPFLFTITDSVTHEIVFIGTVNNPQ